MTHETLTHKRGDSFDVLVPIPAFFPDGYFAGCVVESEMWTLDRKFIAALECNWTDPATTRSLRLVCLDTKAWPEGAAQTDIQFTRTSDGFVYTTSTELLFILGDVTGSPR